MNESCRNPGARQSAADILANLPTVLPEGRVTIGALVEATREHGFVVLLLLLASIAMLPIPIWPFLGAAIAVLCFDRLVLTDVGSPPAWLLRRSVPRRTVTRACHATASLVRRFEPVVRRRYPAVLSYFTDRALTLVFSVMAVLLMLPVPVLNWLPCTAILLIALGWFIGDGLCVLFGLAVAAGSAAAYAMVMTWLIGFI